MGANRIHPSIFLALDAIMIPCLLIGKERIRFPVEEKIAFTKVGAASGGPIHQRLQFRSRFQLFLLKFLERFEVS